MKNQAFRKEVHSWLIKLSWQKPTQASHQSQKFPRVSGFSWVIDLTEKIVQFNLSKLFRVSRGFSEGYTKMYRR